MIAMILLSFGMINTVTAQEKIDDVKYFEDVEKYDSKIKKQLTDSDQKRIHDKVKINQKTFQDCFY